MFSAVNLLFAKRSIKSGSPVAAQSTTVSTSAVSATGYSADVTGTSPVQFVGFDVQVSNVRVRWDGTDPTSTVGTLLYAGTNYQWPVDIYNSARFIRDTAATSDAILFAHPLTS